MSEDWNTLKLIRWTAEYFRKKGIPNPRLDAELLLARVLKCPRIDLYTQYEKRVPEKNRIQFRSYVERRAKREPLQYILGETEFWGLKIKVTPDVLIPRPETELLVEEALRIVGAGPRACPDGPDTRIQGQTRQGQPQRVAPTKILEIGTGSGCIAIALAKNIPGAKIIATDISKEALALAQENIKNHGLQDHIKTILADIAPWKSLEAEEHKFDLILSNPPYIPSHEIPTLQEEVGQFEPKTALDGGENGQKIIQKILEEAPAFLAKKAYLLLEIGEEQSTSLPQSHGGLQLKRFQKDYSGAYRIAVYQNSPRPSRATTLPFKDESSRSVPCKKS